MYKKYNQINYNQINYNYNLLYLNKLFENSIFIIFFDLNKITNTILLNLKNEILKINAKSIILNKKYNKFLFSSYLKFITSN
jgi:hypothetical protein